MNLSKAKDLYPRGWEGSDEEPWPGYTPILNSFGDIICRVDIPDIGGHHGDTQVLLRNDGKYGYLMFGWGSCSGCDSLLRCKTYEEVDELIESTYGQIRWFDDDKEALGFFMNHEWKHDHAFSRVFVNFGLAFFSSRVDGWRNE